MLQKVEDTKLKPGTAIDMADTLAGARALHAANYIAFNYLPFRFAFYAISSAGLAICGCVS